MRTMQVRWAAGVCVAAALVGGGVYVRAQAQAQAADTPSLAAIAGELRLLRQAVEKSTDTQTQIQALTAALSAQQSRLLQVSARAEAVRKDADTAASAHAQVVDDLSRYTTQLSSGVLSAEARDQATLEMKALRQQEQKLAAQESQARTSFTAADAAVQTELARWTDLMTRLDQLARR